MSYVHDGIDQLLATINIFQGTNVRPGTGIASINGYLGNAVWYNIIYAIITIIIIIILLLLSLIIISWVQKLHEKKKGGGCGGIIEATIVGKTDSGSLHLPPLLHISHVNGAFLEVSVSGGWGMVELRAKLKENASPAFK